MLIDDLRSDINHELSAYISRSTVSFNKLPRKRQMDIIIISNILKKSDAVLVIKELTAYLDQICLPYFLSFLTFIDINHFVARIRNILNQNKYQLINVMQTIIFEKDGLITLLASAEQKPSNKKEVLELLFEIKWLKNENCFLYKTLGQLEQEIVKLKQVKNLSLTRVDFGTHSKKHPIRKSDTVQI